MPDPKRIEIEVYTKDGDLIASFGNPIPTPSNPSAVLTDDERREIMVEPTVRLVQNGESSFTFKMLVSSEKFHLIKGIGNRFHVNGRVYTALTDDAIVYGYEGEDARIATVTLVEEQYTLQKKFVQAYNVMPYSKSLAASGAACVEYDRTNKVASIATFVIASTDANFSKALLWDITDTIYILEPSDTWIEPPKYVNPVSITKTDTTITITFYNLGGAIPLGATALFGAGIESIDDHTVTILPKANKKYKLTIDGVQYEDSVVLDERGILMPRGSGGYALWSVIRHSGWQLGTCDMLHAQFNTSQVDAVCTTQVRDFTGIYGTYKESSGTWVFDLAQSTDSAFRRALNWKVGDTLYLADVSTIDGAPEWTNAPYSAHITYFNATDSRITIRIDSTGTIANDCVVAFSNSGAALEARFVVPSTDAGFAHASTWETGYSMSIYDAVGWADAPTSARIVGSLVNDDGNLEITILNLGGLISAGSTVRFISGNEIGVFNCETDAKDIFENIKLIQELWGGVIVFDSLHKIVHYRDEDKEGTDFNTWNGFTIKRGKNLTSTPSVSWNADIITRLYPLGADKLNIALVNDGKRYVDDFSFTDEVLEGYVDQPNIYDTLDDGGMLQLLYWSRREVSKVCRPRKTVKYENKVVDRRLIGGYEFDVFDLNSIVKAYYIDSETGEETSELLRIVNWEYDVWNPLNKTTLEVGDIKANVRDIFKLIYKKTEEMPVFDAKGRISADDISVGSASSSSSRRGGGGGGGGGTLADALEEQIITNGRFFSEFNDVHATIGFEAQYLRTFEGVTNESLGRIAVDLSETEAYLEAVIEHNYTDLQGQLTTSQAGLQEWANNEFAKATLLANYYTKDETGTLVSSSNASVIAYADAKYATATLLAQYKNETDTNIAGVRAYADSKTAQLQLYVNNNYVTIDQWTTWLDSATIHDGEITNLYCYTNFQYRFRAVSWSPALLTLNSIITYDSAPSLVTSVTPSYSSVIETVYLTKNSLGYVTNVTVAKKNVVSSIWAPTRNDVPRNIKASYSSSNFLIQG